MSGQQPPAAENTLSKSEENVVSVKHTSCQCYFRPETGDLIFLSESDSGEFDELTQKLSRLMALLDDAREKYSAAMQAYFNKKKDIVNQEKLPSYFNAVVAAELEVEKATKAIQQEVGEFDAEKGYSPVVELISLEPLKKSVYGRFYCYLKKSDYDAFKEKLTLFNLKNFGSEDFYQRDKDGNIVAINKDEIIARYKKIKESLSEMCGGSKSFSLEGEYDKSLADWADAWNERDDYSMEGQIIDVSAGAQFLRFSSNAGASVEWDPRKGEGQIKGEAQAELILASAHASTTFYQPDRSGWQLKFIINDENKEANLGVLRAKLEASLTGFAGASANIEGNLQFVVSDGQQKIMGIRSPLSRLEERLRGIHVDTEKEPTLTMDVGGELFAGVKAGGTFGGALQWLKPFNSLVEHLPDMLRTFGIDAVLSGDKVLDKVIQSRDLLTGDSAEEGEFTDFAAFNVGAEVQAGVGLSGDFSFTFEQGKFKFHVAAGICLGAGAEGSAQGEVSPQQFTEFAVWAVYQLYGMDYHHFKVISKDAFMALTYILLMGGKYVYENYFNKLRVNISTVFEDFDDFIKEMATDISGAVEASNKRNQFAESINRSPSNVYAFTPEGKGIALYLLVQDGSYDRIDLNNHRLASVIDNTENGPILLPDTGHERKKAVLTILSSIQTRREWTEVLVRMTASGEKIPAAMPEARQVEHQEQIIRTFLQIGLNQDKKLDALITQLELRDFRETYQRLKDKPAFGYPFAPNCSKQYALYCDDNPWYTSLCHIVPQDPTVKNRMEP